MNSVAKQRRFEDNKKQVLKFAEKHNLIVQELNRGYQLRLGGVIDIYPVNKRWHYLSTNDRGDYDDIRELDIAIFANVGTMHWMGIDFSKQNEVGGPPPHWKYPKSKIWDPLSESKVHILPMPDTQELINMIEGNDKNRRRKMSVWQRLVKFIRRK